MAGWQQEVRTYLESAIARQLTASSPRAEQPACVRVPMRPHQLSLLAAARELEKAAVLKDLDLGEARLMTNYGVLADRVGAGKTLVAMALARDPPPRSATLSVRKSGGAQIVRLAGDEPIREVAPEWCDLSSGEAFMLALAGGVKHAFDRRILTRTSLAVVPHTVVNQWESYAKEQMGRGFKAVFVKRKADCAWDSVEFYRRVFTADLVVVSNTMFKWFVGALTFYGQRFDRIVWSRLFVDEADTTAMGLREGEVTARFRWFITGSWLNMALPTGVDEWSVKAMTADLRGLVGDGAVPGVTASRTGLVCQTLADSRHPLFTATILRSSDAWIDESLAPPPILVETVMCQAPANLAALANFVTPAAMEALHAGDTAGAMLAMGLKPAAGESVAERVTAGLRAELRAAEKMLAFKADMEYSSATAKAEGVAKATTRVVRLREQLSSLEARVAGLLGSAGAATPCPICYDPARTATLTPCCRQVFCLECLCECVATKPICPLCRVAIRSAKDLIVVGADASGGGGDETTEVVLPTKGAALLRMLTEGCKSAEARYLVFSAHEASFRGLRDVLAARGVRCEMLSGTAARVERLRKQFREGKVQVLCMNARYVGAGINLEPATHVVLYHRMNSELERQVIGRAVRFERAAELRVIHLVHETETGLNGLGVSTEVIVHV
jgi:hypothetical protein